jgi:hypothetical protein
MERTAGMGWKPKYVVEAGHTKGLNGPFVGLVYVRYADSMSEARGEARGCLWQLGVHEPERKAGRGARRAGPWGEPCREIWQARTGMDARWPGCPVEARIRLADWSTGA